MADAVISVVVERAAAILEEQIVYEVNLVRGAEKKVRCLSDKLKTIKTVLEDAEKRGAKEEIVKNWLRKLEDATYKMEDILDEWKLYTLLKHKQEKVCCSFIPSSSSFKNLSSRRKIGKDIQTVEANVDEIIKEKDEFGFVMSSTPSDVAPKPPRVQSTSSIELEKVCGYDIYRNEDAIVNKLMVISGSSQVVSIVGMGGLGKTTLAQLVYNDTRVKESFELTAWICVSDPFNVGEIARGIVESVTKEVVSRDTNRLEFVLEKLRDCISGKKFLVVLDDVWIKKLEDWEPLRNILIHGAEGSKIMVTTRKEGVAKMMGTFDNDIYRPQHLTDDECWSLLRRISHSGRSEEECRKFEEVGKEIAKKCRGLPLAAKVLGSLLQCKRSLEEWDNVLESEIWQLEKAEVELFPHLLLSYNELSPTLKRCFSYCSVYPKDFEISVASLIEEWKALGYLGSIARKDGAEVKGRDYFNDLATRSLFQDFEQSGEWSEEIEMCKMHDIVHDFALFLRKNNDGVLEAAAETKTKSCELHDPLIVSRVREYRSLYWDKATPPNLCDCVKSVRVLRFKGKLHNPPKGIEKLIHLRFLELSGTKLFQEDLQMICRLYFLETLLLESCSLGKIPSEIGDLVQLRHLDLSNNSTLKELPESMCSLVELQILNIEGCSSGILPKRIDKLENLQHLLSYRDPMSRFLPRGFVQCTLTTSFHARDKLELLKNLNRLAGTLELEMPVRSSSCLQKLAEDVREAELRNKPHIRSLLLQFRNHVTEPSNSLSSSLWRDVIEGLEPHPNVDKLCISEYGGTRLPRWITSPLYLIKEIDLSDLRELLSLPPMGKLPFLEVLYVKRLMKMKVLERQFLGPESCTLTNDGALVAFPQLKKLRFDNLPSWKEWEDITEQEENSGNVKIMPHLTVLHIDRCPSLKELPRCFRRRSPRLRIKCHYTLHMFSQDFSYEESDLAYAYSSLRQSEMAALIQQELRERHKRQVENGSAHIRAKMPTSFHVHS